MMFCFEGFHGDFFVGVHRRHAAGYGSCEALLVLIVEFCEKGSEFQSLVWRQRRGICFNSAKLMPKN